MDWLKSKLFESQPFRELAAAVTDSRVLVRNAPGSLPVLIAGFLNERLARPVLFVAETLEDAEEAADDLTVLLGESAVSLLPPRPHFDRPLTSVEQSERAEVLLRLARGERPVAAISRKRIAGQFRGQA